MAKLPIISGMEAIKALSKIGYEIDHQTGSHLILRHKEEPHRRLTVPNHKELAKGTLRAVIRQSGLTREEFLKLLWYSFKNAHPNKKLQDTGKRKSIR